MEADAICPKRTWLCFLSPTIFRLVADSFVESCWSFFCAKLPFRNTGPLSFDPLPFITRLTSAHSFRPGVAVSSVEKPSLPGLGGVLCAQRAVPADVRECCAWQRTQVTPGSPGKHVIRPRELCCTQGLTIKIKI